MIRAPSPSKRVHLWQYNLSITWKYMFNKILSWNVNNLPEWAVLRSFRFQFLLRRGCRALSDCIQDLLSGFLWAFWIHFPSNLSMFCPTGADQQKYQLSLSQSKQRKSIDEDFCEKWTCNFEHVFYLVIRILQAFDLLQLGDVTFHFRAPSSFVGFSKTLAVFGVIFVFIFVWHVRLGRHAANILSTGGRGRQHSFAS